MDIDAGLAGSYEEDTDSPGVHSKPCQICRRRKVKCSKTEPCSNCERAGEECKYDDSVASIAKRPTTTATLAARVTQLENLVRKLSLLSPTRPDQGNESSVAGSRTPRHPVFLAEQVEQNLSERTPLDHVNDAALYQGRLITDGHSSRHLMNSFWASMYSEVTQNIVICYGTG